MMASNSGRGRFIVFEGIDGSGKTTASKSLVDSLRASGLDAEWTCEPTGTWTGDAVRKGSKEARSPATEALLYAADRSEHAAWIDETVSKGAWVVCDRYLGSSLAYQGAVLGGALEWLKSINGPIAIEPDVTFLMRLEPEEAMRRMSGREGAHKYEKLEFLRKVDSIYSDLAAEHSYVVLDASLPPERVVASARAALGL